MLMKIDLNWEIEIIILGCSSKKKIQLLVIECEENQLNFSNMKHMRTV